MRYNMFVQQDGTMYGALVCSVCNKNVILEQENQPDMSKYGDGARLLTVLGSPRPPQGSRRKAGKDAAIDETR
jgi:hypothetical protein